MQVQWRHCWALTLPPQLLLRCLWQWLRSAHPAWRGCWGWHAAVEEPLRHHEGGWRRGSAASGGNKRIVALALLLLPLLMLPLLLLRCASSITTAQPSG